jgi:hypothetical protein
MSGRQVLADQLTAAVVVVIAQRLMFKLGKQFHPDVADKRLPGPLE